MRRFLVGDELGNIKAISYSPDASHGDDKTATKTLWNGASDAVEVLAVGPSSQGVGSQLLFAGFSSGLASTFSLDYSTGQLQEIFQWQETRLRTGQKYIGLEVSEKTAFSCTSNGALRSISLGSEAGSPEFRLSSLPTRLCVWRMTTCQNRFAYGGDEVDVSVWDTERAFTPQSSSSEYQGKKRKRDTLFPGELWRAKNVQNDTLGLRQPLRITSLTYLAPLSASHHLAAGTELGNVRRYDTRASKRPVSDWKIAKVGGVRSIEKGMSEHELFASDYGSNLYSLDLRNGGIAYGYQGIAGAVTSLAPSPNLLASTSQDRFVRIHSTFPLTEQTGQQQGQKGQILDQVFMKCAPTTIVWDNIIEQEITTPIEDDVWETLETTEIDSDGQSKRRKKRLD